MGAVATLVFLLYFAGVSFATAYEGLQDGKVLRFLSGIRHPHYIYLSNNAGWFKVNIGLHVLLGLVIIGVVILMFRAIMKDEE